MKLTIHLVPLLLCACATASAQQQLDAQSRWQPQSFVLNGQPTAYYEIILTNTGSDTLSIDSVQLSNRDCISFNTALSANLLAPQATGIAYIEATMNSTLKGRELVHRICYRTQRNGVTKVSDVHVFKQGMAVEEPVVLGPPLYGGPWIGIYDPSWQRGNRRVIYTVAGRARIPGRHAIDFMLLDDQGKTVKGNADSIVNWLGYGAAVLAVADGVVHSMQNNFTESPTVSQHPRYSAGKAAGNYIAIAIGNGRYAFYEHLQPASIRVREGQKVKKGEVIAKLGFTGQTTGPHLHFHVADAPSALGAEGLPFVFEEYEELGAYTGLDDLGKLPWIKNEHPHRQLIRMEKPAPNVVLKFAGASL